MSSIRIVPVTCPKCGERQNSAPGGFDPDREPFGPVLCMVCGHRFTAEEYRSGRRQALAEMASRHAPKPSIN